MFTNARLFTIDKFTNARFDCICKKHFPFQKNLRMDPYSSYHHSSLHSMQNLTQSFDFGHQDLAVTSSTCNYSGQSTSSSTSSNSSEVIAQLLSLEYLLTNVILHVYMHIPLQPVREITTYLPASQAQISFTSRNDQQKVRRGLL